MTGQLTVDALRELSLTTDIAVSISGVDIESSVRDARTPFLETKRSADRVRVINIGLILSGSFFA